MLAAASPVPVPLFEADGSIDPDDRFALLHLYGGLVGTETIQDTTYYLCYIRDQ